MSRSLSQTVGWIAAALLTALLTVILFLPASWLGAALEQQSGGRFSLGDVQGSFWRGSAFIGVAAGPTAPVTPLFAGRFSWKISPLLLLGQVDVQLENADSLSAPLHINGNFSQWQISPAVLSLPPERLEGLGAPLNTIGPTGKLHLSWNNLSFTRSGALLSAQGQLQLELAEMASRLSQVRPLGSYRVEVNLQGMNAEMTLLTLSGPMMLAGAGAVSGGRFHFSGKAWAAAGQEDKLANLLNLLGQRRKDGNQDVIALDFK
ncbi:MULTISPECIES: type II secretion system protein N [unclassified Undibacterium]|uniref:type II secretion system protein N n=1 Tax=unclassified Undibacterium TaxID=2630295 RepID=UPI002AC9A368|nr:MULTISPECIES: type II secretion system protein N [unclassified Undibacterium]MEB0138344.1 type II secretion system protein N [Undibacterium sp. CCC2.1]MEB0172721.1 type II secretion system protein N [Undibacterium sp. CCC1.1]MEB0174719.1 type II secretion system protein N [Undibacterium sp. CCC3.4]MEB0213916.1 type II secretion system protein N [Undibacterium sp. 5I2]WPX42640.1 type II secretion system protein N [Undibacterium sp. CCC3.4]